MDINRINRYLRTHPTTNRPAKSVYTIDIDDESYEVAVYEEDVHMYKLVDREPQFIEPVEYAFLEQFCRAVAPDREIHIFDPTGITVV